MQISKRLASVACLQRLCHPWPLWPAMPHGSDAPFVPNTLQCRGVLKTRKSVRFRHACAAPVIVSLNAGRGLLGLEDVGSAGESDSLTTICTPAARIYVFTSKDHA